MTGPKDIEPPAPADTGVDNFENPVEQNLGVFVMTEELLRETGRQLKCFASFEIFWILIPFGREGDNQ
jgi:hypothetical protein